MESETITIQDGVVAIELPAPEGWKKKFTPKKGGTPRRNEIVFISPTDEEIKNKRQLDQYLKIHPGGPSASEFDWGTGDTPRRSTRLSGKSKAVETPESDTPEKKLKTSSSKKEAKGRKADFEGEGESTEDKEAAAKETKEIDMEDAEDVGHHGEGEIVSEYGLADKDNVDHTEQKTEENIDKVNMEKPENEDTGSKTSDAKEEDAENRSLPMPGIKENSNETAEEPTKPEDPSELPVPGEVVPEVADAKVEQGFEDAKAGQEDNHNEEAPAEKVANAEAAKPENASLKEDQEVGKPLGNHSVSGQCAV